MNRTIDHAICAFTLPTQYIAAGQESIIDDEDKVKIKIDPISMSLVDVTTSQLEEVVDGWVKFVSKKFREALEKVRAFLGFSCNSLNIISKTLNN